ncbi:MAG: hypothetical protein RBS40_00055 [Rhodocyclaceae bacterium]|jgi:hypothetical protein|nr:hypothetical protein [Rhodocyclaceae bacterium]
MTKGEFTGYLYNRLQIQDWLREVPEIARQGGGGAASSTAAAWIEA